MTVGINVLLVVLDQILLITAFASFFKSVCPHVSVQDVFPCRLPPSLNPFALNFYMQIASCIKSDCLYFYVQIASCTKSVCPYFFMQIASYIKYGLPYMYVQIACCIKFVCPYFDIQKYLIIRLPILLCAGCLLYQAR